MESGKVESGKVESRKVGRCESGKGGGLRTEGDPPARCAATA